MRTQKIFDAEKLEQLVNQMLSGDSINHCVRETAKKGDQFLTHYLIDNKNGNVFDALHGTILASNPDFFYTLVMKYKIETVEALQFLKQNIGCEHNEKLFLKKFPKTAHAQSSMFAHSHHDPDASQPGLTWECSRNFG